MGMPWPASMPWGVCAVLAKWLRASGITLAVVRDKVGKLMVASDGEDFVCDPFWVTDCVPLMALDRERLRLRSCMIFVCVAGLPICLCN